MKYDEIKDAIDDYLRDEDWKYQYEADKHLFSMGLGLKSRLRNCRIYIDVKEDSYLVYLVSPVSADRENPVEIMKFLTLANYGLINGNFEMDLNDGEIRYKTYVNCDGLVQLPKQVIEDSIHAAAYTLDLHGNGIAALAMGFSAADTEYENVRAEMERRLHEQGEA